ncbi:Nn.00g088610.m01.CDS01 [Neocucurbitaria sp. VM-36]
MFNRQTTPPTSSFSYIPGSVGSDATYYSQGSSPDVNTAGPTPPRSPVRQYGPVLLPKVRTQDQVAEPTQGPIRHRRTTSSSSISYAYSPYSRPASMVRRGSSPFNHNIHHNTHSTLTSPVSNSSYDFNLSTLNSPITFTQPDARRASSYMGSQSRSTSANRARHARSDSAGSVDENVISKYGFPTYRNLPNYVTASSAPQSNLSLVTCLPSTYSSVQEIPSYTTTCTQDFVVPEFEPAPAVQYTSLTNVNFDTYQPVAATSSLVEYLSSPNPSPSLVRRVTNAPRGINNHFWWDIRNLRSWEDFNITTIKSIPSVLPLLEVPVPASYLPQPCRQNLQPENESALHDICTNYYANKVNAALKVAQGNTHMVMRAVKSIAGSRQQPEFISNYPSDYEKTLFGDSRGRVVGLVKCYDQWNTGMRSESPPKQVLYLQGLAHLHRVMREHGCRYGFIMTEIELLCVRCGGPSDAATVDPTTVNAQTGVPIFGYLETSAPIRLSTQGSHPETGDIQLTAPLALWYLHMLAKENPFEGMGTWRMDVGGPAALTRQNFLEKDSWIPKPQLGEKRESKRVRGWVFPDEPLSKRECGKGKRGKSIG